METKYREGMTSQQFLYCNYGFTYTKEQERKAFGDYIRLSQKKAIKEATK